MEDMNVIETVAETGAVLEAPVCEAANADGKANIVGAVVTTATVITVWELGKRLVKKCVTGVKNFVASKKAAKIAKEEAVIEVDCVEED
jgi:hypothetical protein